MKYYVSNFHISMKEDFNLPRDKSFLTLFKRSADTFLAVGRCIDIISKHDLDLIQNEFTMKDILFLKKNPFDINKTRGLQLIL